MGFFKKSINTKATELYYRHAITHLLSNDEMKSHKSKLDELIETIPEFKGSFQRTFDSNLTAANLQTLDFAWAEFQKSKGLNVIEGIKFNLQLRKIAREIPNYENYDELYTSYNQAVASASLNQSSMDQMAKVFIVNVMPKKMLDKMSSDRAMEVCRMVAEFMQGSFEAFTSDMKDLNLIF